VPCTGGGQPHSWLASSSPSSKELDPTAVADGRRRNKRSVAPYDRILSTVDVGRSEIWFL